ncbi:S-adenosylmethionine decarboxylase proenzyme [Heliobacillus mobilis]|uniref:S-adenosylmethionine decarboxylase proenzyme n=2 Tax=Heliobacterium TaxID=2697 RepID=A0A6I3SPV7_HELMO|nr:MULTISPECIES: adenosylmethionine decarboxylase [Heliobacterium]MBC9785821.1 S-adenosylmethionine decarboxylase proenzyme [Heliobacterium chlorum]MTV50297.1 S-adenosylmethionine decarboxylase proenzyme [Heliobacterium mobile]
MSVLGRPLGVQLLAEVWDCNAEKLNDMKMIEEIMVRAAEKAGAEIREVVFHRFEPQGVSGVVVISESHLTIHTWPELSYAAVDIFTCGERVDPWVALDSLAQELDAEEAHAMEISRGMKNLKRLRKMKEEQGNL